MKKLLILAVVTMTCVTGFSKTIDGVFNSFSKDSNAQLVSVPNLKDAVLTQKNGKDVKALVEKTKNIEMVQLLTVDKATDKQIKRARKIAANGVDGMEQLVRVNEKGEEVTIFAAKNRGKIVQLLILSIDKGDVGICFIMGDLDLNDIHKVSAFNRFCPISMNALNLVS